MNKAVLKCPKYSLDKAKRIDQLLTNCKEWIYSEHLLELIHLFDKEGGMDNYGNNFKDDLIKLHTFVQRWDYRKGQERWTVQDDSFIEENESIILNSAKGLDLRDHVRPSVEAEYILPLGGARRANYVRPLMAKKVLNEFNWRDKTIVALAGTRPINEIEKPFINDYAPYAATEYEAICSGVEKAFEVSRYDEIEHDDDNINSKSAVRQYESNGNERIYCLAAPSSDPLVRRANSYDTFQFFLQTFGIKKEDRLLLVTSCIYVPFQLLKFMMLAIENGFEVDCIGADPIDGYTLSKTSNYLQEIKGTVDAIYELTMHYL